MINFNKFNNGSVNISTYDIDYWDGVQTIDVAGIPISVNFSIPISELKKQPSTKSSGVYLISIEDYSSLQNDQEERYFLDWPAVYVGSAAGRNTIKKRAQDFSRELRRGRDGRTDNGRHSSAWALHDKLSESDLDNYCTNMVVSYASFDTTTIPRNMVNDVIRLIERGLILKTRSKWPSHLCNLT